jgi:ribosomal-protein-alanine N-acetyltransferase
MESSQKPFKLMPAGLSDLGALRAMEKVCFPLDGWPLLELIAFLMLPNLVRIKAVVNGEMAGFIGGDIRRSQNAGWITTLSVFPQYQRLGIATALLEECERELGMPTVKLTVRASNFGAQRLYLGQGYRHVDTWERYYEGGEDGFIFQKVI